MVAPPERPDDSGPVTLAQSPSQSQPESSQSESSQPQSATRPASADDAEQARLRELGAEFAGNPAAFEAVYALLAPGVLRLLRRMLPAADAEDVLQNTFTDVWRSRAQYDGTRPLRGWVLGIARHRCADILRARVPEPIGDLVDREEAGKESGDGMAERVVRAQLLRDALRTLPVEQREVLVLAYFRQLTQSEIAEWLDLPLGTVKARSARGLRAVAGALRNPDREEGLR